MYYKMKKMKKVLLILVCIIVSIVLCASIIAKINEERRNSIALGTHISKDEATNAGSSVSHELHICPDGGTWRGTTENTILTIRTGETIPIEDPIREGYIFDGWLSLGDWFETGERNLFKNSYTYTYGDDGGEEILHAQWTKISEETPDENVHTLYINPNGGIWNGSSEMSTITGKKGEKIQIVEPTREGYTFIGWIKTGNGASTPSFTTMSGYMFGDSDGALSAQWTKISEEISHNLYINPNGGTWDGLSGASTKTGKKGETIQISIPTREGYTFAGWTKTGNGGTMSSLTGNATYTFGDSDDTITAEWTKIPEEISHNLYINPNGGTWNGLSGASTKIGKKGETIQISIPTREGYTFAGWTKTGNGGTMSSLTGNATYTFGDSDDTITAEWTKIPEEISHNLYINPNGGTWNGLSGASTKTGKKGETIQISIPTREGYTFAGWTKTGNGGTMSSLTGNATYTFGDSDDTLTAKWIKDTSTDNPQKPGDTDNPGGSTDNPQKPSDTDNPGGSTDNPQKPGETDNPGGSTDNPQKPGDTDNPGGSTDNPQKPGETDNPGGSTDNPQKPSDTDNPGSSSGNTQKPGDTDNPGSSSGNLQKPGDTDNPGSSSGNTQKPGDTDNPGSSSGNTQKPGDTDNPGSSSGNPQKPDDTNNQGGSTNNSQNLSGTNNSNKKDETITNQDKLPHTGMGIGLGIGVLLAGIFVIIMFKKVKYYKEI